MRELRAVEADPGREVMDGLLPAVEAALDGVGPAVLPVPGGGARERLLAAMRVDQPLERDDVALVVPTSGSTGEPKGALLTAGALRHSATATSDRLGGPGQWLLALPVTGIAGLQVLVRSLVGGTRPVVLDLSGGFDVSAFAEATRRLDPAARHYTALVPTQLRRLLNAGVDLSPYDAILVGGGPLAGYDLPTPVGRSERRPGHTISGGSERGQAGTTSGGSERGRVVTTYGMTETCGGCVYDGRPLDGVEVTVGPDGRVRVAGPVVFSGYRLRPDLTAESLVAGQHLTNDLGRWRPDGRLEVLGRADDVVVSGGVNVPAALVERVLADHPDVAVCAVVGRPDAEWGERVVAVVQPTGWDRAPTLDALRGFAADRLEPAALPREVVVLGRLPMLASGKPDKAAVRTLLGATADG